jgi:soluble lytic murein transglycosylase-like protein
MRKVATILAVVLAPMVLHAQASVEERFEQLRAERFEAVAAVAIAPAAPPLPPAPTLPETTADLFAPPWRVRLSEADWQLLQETFRAEGVPVELLAVGWVESRFNQLALSPKGARGVWQLMPATARRYGLQVSAERDERTDLRLSTRVAARHLADLYAQFSDWPLALAAYNAGAGRVGRALAHARSRDFWRLRTWLPAETQSYVPAVLDAIPSDPSQHDPARR